MFSLDTLNILLFFLDIFHSPIFILCCKSMPVFYTGISIYRPINTFNFSFDFLRSLLNFGLDLSLTLVDLTSVRGFDFNFDLIQLSKQQVWFSFFLPSTLNKLPFVLTFGVTRKISKPNRLYSNISKTTSIAIISPTVPKK